jgi:ABC-2 type transport system ATP-binding protein
MQAEFGMTVLLTTHYMEEADALCDRVALMHHGRLQAVGTPLN